MTLIPSLFPLLSGNAAVAAIVATRIYPHGQAPQQVVAPYITVAFPTIVPEIVLDGPAPIDRARAQVSCWSVNSGAGATGIDTLGLAVRRAIEPVHCVVDVRDMGQDPVTSRYRIDLDVIIWHENAASS